MASVPRVIEGFRQDEDGAWIAALDCGHDRHVRHQPPLSSYAWVDDPDGRADKVGSQIECERCGARLIPETVHGYKRTAVFDEHTLPAGLSAAHNTRAGVWARVHVLEGELRLAFEEPLAVTLTIEAGGTAAIPPEVRHAVTPLGAVKMQVEFLRRG